MKRIFCVLSFALAVVSIASAQRLPDVAAPENYKLAFNPDLDQAKFTGDETIAIRVLKPTAEITLNSADIEIQEATISNGKATQKAAVTFQKDKEMVVLAVPKQLAAGPATIHIKYTGILNSEMRGLYLGKDDQGRKYAATQFESTDARRAFPSFDEPAYKATFDISVVADKGLATISNSKIASDTPGPGDKRTVTFATTPKMSSYLAALIVGNFEYTEGEADGIPIRIYVTPGKKELTKFAMETTEFTLHFYDQYFGIKYPYGKLDLIGLPDFSAGAMENTGCITYREVALLADEHATVDTKKGVAVTITHEMAHQWFGDLVTAKWWDDIWLNEGFATWMSSKPIAAWKPEWHMDLDDASGTGGSLGLDSLANTRPIHQSAETPSQILELFDGIAYGKAASVLRMVEAYLGPETFRAGTNEYLKEHSYSNATAEDFWGTLARVSKKPVDKIMSSYVKQAGAPLVSVSAKCVAGKSEVKLSQRRFFYDAEKLNASNPEVWLVPVCLKSYASGKTSEKCEVLTKKEETFTQDGCADWVFANAGATGYYRAGYQPEAVRALAAAAEQHLTPAERIALQGDVWASIRAGNQPVGDYLALVEGYSSDRTRAVMDDLLGRLDYVDRYLVNDSDRQAYQAWLRNVLRPAASEIGWEPKPSDSEEQKAMRGRIFGALGYGGRDPQVLADADKVTERVLDNPASVDRELAGTALGLSADRGDEALYNRILAAAKKAKSPEEYYGFLYTLTQFSDPKLLTRTLELALSSDVRSQDSLGLVATVMGNRSGQRLGWDFVQSHWAEIQKAGGPFAAGAMVGSTGGFCDAGLRDQVTKFFSEHKSDAERTYRQSLERINSCIDLKAKQSGNLAAWLSDHKVAGE